jgi:putative ABC transport system ATP-binding protein
MLHTRGLVKHYFSDGGEEVRAVDGVDLCVERGELVALYGPSGSGKTTLLELIAGAEQADRGTIGIDGEDVARFSPNRMDEYRLNVLGVVPQSLQLIAGLTALDLAALRLTEQGLSWPEAHRRAKPLLDRLGLRRRVDHRAGQLSKGERQRVALAMALSTTPSLVLADEPTANLDSRLVHDVLGMLVEFCHEHDAAVLLVTHDPAAQPFADRILALRDGRVIVHEVDADADAART